VRSVLLAGLGLLGLFAGSAAAQSNRSGTAGPRLEVAQSAEPEVVFRWQTQRCSDMHLPDSPARALRIQKGIALFAAHLVNIPLLGRDFSSLRASCDASSRGAESGDPARFQDRFWVQAVVPLEPLAPGMRRRVLGLASHEYMGWRHPGRCLAPFGGAGRRPAAFRCWYSSITAVVTEEGDWRFRPVLTGSAEQGRSAVIAASPIPYNERATARTGFFSVTNAVIEDGYALALVYTEGVAGQLRGNCLFRAPLSDAVDGWRALSAGEFRQQYRSAYDPSAGRSGPCDVVGASVFGGAPVRSLLRVPGSDGPRWVAVFTRAAPKGRPAEGAEGVFYSTSRDLRSWSPAVRLWAVTPFRSQPEAGIYYEYPSLLDHASTSEVFDRVADDPQEVRLHLYMTRLNLADRRRGLDRDLVRVPVAISQ
jgi:hypothetical protein